MTSAKYKSDSNGPARRARVSGRNRTTRRLIGLAVLGHMLRSRRFYERVALAGIAVAALSGLGQENRVRASARLATWNGRQIELLERKAEPAAKRIAAKA